MKEISINGKKIGQNYPIFLIAEAGVNHNGDINIAKKLIDIAVDAKVDAVKFQSFKTSKVLLKTVPKAEYAKKNKDDNESYYDMVKKLELNKENFRILKKYCTQKGIIFLSTPFDEVSVEWLEDIGITAYKISSTDLNNYILLKYICLKKKPILLSTGMSNMKEVKESVSFILSNNINKLVILQCTTNYPAEFEELNLNVIDTYKKEFPEHIIGFSDHSLGIEASIGAAAKGAKVIEKHFTLDKKLDGPDHKASLNPKELKDWVKGVRNVELALGSYEKLQSKAEFEIKKIARRSIVSKRDILAGKILNESDITAKRPSSGISPNRFMEVLGKKTKKAIPKNSIINWDDLL